MNYKFFLQGIKNTFLNPAKAWEIIDSDNRPVKMVRDSFVFPLLILVSVSTVIGSLIFVNSELSPVYSLFAGVKVFALMLFTIYSTAFILKEITYPLDLGRDFDIAFRIIAYSIAPFLLCQVLSRIFESFLFVNIIGLYGLYIFWIGTEKMLTPPQHKKMPMLIATTISMIGIYIVTNLVLNMLVDRIYNAFFA